MTALSAMAARDADENNRLKDALRKRIEAVERRIDVLTKAVLTAEQARDAQRIIQQGDQRR